MNQHLVLAVAGSLLLVGCGSSDGGDAQGEPGAGTGGSAGSGVSGSGGSTSAGGSGGAAGKGSSGSSGQAGTAGAAGHAGSSGAGQGGAGGSAGHAGGAGGQPSGGHAGTTSAGGEAGSAAGGQPGGGMSGSSGQGGAGGDAGGQPGGGSGGQPSGGQGGSSPSGLTVSGNQLLRDGKPWRPHGVNHSSTEYACIQGWGISEGPTDATLVTPMLAWNINAVRLPLNEDCWLSLNGVDAKYSGSTYKQAIGNLLNVFHAQGLVVILDLHWNGAGSQKADGQRNMADKDHAIDFWKDVAATFKDDHEVIFDLYNEPHDISWDCWKNGCSDPGFATAGMQDLVTAVRSVGATQPLMLGGLAWANDLTQWLDFMPTDPEKALVASHHDYNFNSCVNESCWNSQLGKVAAKVPVVTGELGENDCGSGYIDKYMPWADANNVGYMGWTWNTWDCSTGPALVTAYDGTATAFGAGYRDHVKTLGP